MGASRLTRLDAFSKTVTDARVRTTTGGLLTLLSLLTILALLTNEYRDYRRTTLHSTLTVDTTRDATLPIRLNITFPHLPCTLLTLDVLDVSGATQSDVSAGLHLTRLTPHPDSRPLTTSQLSLHPPSPAPDYCGPCYGAPRACCNSCDDVRNAYAAVGWAFGDGHEIEQCEREHYAERLAAQRAEGCNIAGSLRVARVPGNFHIAPGKSFTNGAVHVHDLDTYYASPVEHSFTHFIHELSFGPGEGVWRRAETGVERRNPLDGTEQFTEVRGFSFLYFVKVVGTSYVPLGEEEGGPRTVWSHQYAVTSHARNLAGGKDEEHPGAVQARGGIPGVFFNYDISPMRVVNREVREKSFVSLVTGVCAVIGGTLTVAAAVDRGLYEGGLRLKKMHQG